MQQRAQLLLASRRKSVERLEVMAGPTGRRSWSDAVKARIVAESFAELLQIGRVGIEKNKQR